MNYSDKAKACNYCHTDICLVNTDAFSKNIMEIKKV